jgi:hypothetical protein
MNQQSFVSPYRVYYVEVTLQLTVSQYVKVSSPLWDLWPDITFCPKVVFWKLLSCLCGAPSMTKRSGLSFVFLSLVIYQYLHQAFTLHVFYSSAIYVQYIYKASFSPAWVQ